ncbi:MAG: HEAT repeat domain-containing protein [Anaerolineae bacterium]|nr:HEAT repeat domain-containing protein [Anaerolineae bacterium]
MQHVEQMLSRGDVRGLCRALRDRNPLIRRRAAQALGEIKQPASVPHLARALDKDKDQYVLRWTIDALQAVGDQAAIDVLTTALFGADRQIVTLASQALAAIPAPQAESALRVKDALVRTNMTALAEIGEEARRALEIALNSRQFDAWPSGKQKQVLNVAVELGARPPQRYTRELAGTGQFVSGLHTIGDLMAGLRNKKPNVRAAAAEKLGATGQPWARFLLYNRFRHEVRSGGERSVAVAAARALDQLGDERATAHYKQLLYGTDAQQAAEAARTLGEIGTQGAIRALFWFAADPPPSPVYRTTQVLTALENIGPAAVDALRELIDHQSKPVRLMLIGVILRSEHPEMATLLGQMGRDADPGVQRAALDGLADLDTPAAAEMLHQLADDVPHDWVIRALASMTQSESLVYLRNLVPDFTTLSGILVEDNGEPLANVFVQVVREHWVEEREVWEWLAASARTETGPEGQFALALPIAESDATIRAKVVLPSLQDGKDGETFMADLPLEYGKDNQVKMRIDRFFSRLVITTTQEHGDLL